MKTLNRFIQFIKVSEERKRYGKEFVEYLDSQARSLNRPIAVLGMVAWLNYAFNTDPRLHPEFPALLYYRLGLTAVCGIVFALTFSEQARKRGQLMMLAMLFYVYFSSAFFTGRIADDTNYVSGFQIVVMLIVLVPIHRRFSFLVLTASMAIFATAVAIYRPNINTPGGDYSMNNLALAYLVSFLMVYLSDRLRFAVFHERLKLQESNLALEETRDSLWGEMELAKKIQTVLLPKRPAIRGYEISAFMKTAAEVGGDYYDVINAEGLDWVIIGDVSGHGVSAGLIMMMVQTSIRSVLAGAPNLKPEVMLERVNRVITENIKKLDENKYMTVTAIACLRDGRFHHSGLHQEIMIFRAATNTVETVETGGLWIGIEGPAWSSARNDINRLGNGDVMLLYTDGITEAWLPSRPGDASFNPGDMFGAERLRLVLEKAGALHPDLIRDAVLKELEGYRFNDDLTMVILKRIE